MGFSCSNNS
ncbi:hypothetical protein D030_0632A, partial [Vibrio parahaemolyticus AQ3810]